MQTPVQIRQIVLDYFRANRIHEVDGAAVAALFERFAEASSHYDRVNAFLKLMDWSRRYNPRFEHRPVILELIEDQPAIRLLLEDGFTRLVCETSAVNLFCCAGIPSDRGFIAEFIDRLLGRVIPAPRDDSDLAKVMRRVYRRRIDLVRLEEMPEHIYQQFTWLIFPEERKEARERMYSDFQDAFHLLAARVQAQGMCEEMRERSRRGPVAQSPFYRLPRSSEALLKAAGGSGWAEAEKAWRVDCHDCLAELDEVRHRLEDEGVSVDIVYGMEVINCCLRRMERMIAVMGAPSEQARVHACRGLFLRLMEGSFEDLSLGHLVRSNMQLLHRKIVDRSGDTGEHYIARNIREYWQIWLAAAGGGLLTVLTAAVKMEIYHWENVAPFVEGMASGLNYAISFLIMHRFGLILATKQPSMTAATFARIIGEKRGEDRREEITQYAARICRSQLAAAVCNVAMVSIGCYFFVWGWQEIFGHPYLDHETAQHVYDTLSPLSSLTVFYAALTGVVLWMASLAGGWFGNFSAYYRIPQALVEHPIADVIGEKRMARFAEAWHQNIAGWGTNIALGFMLGMTPVMGEFFGLPLDVRHVTLSTGQLALAGASLHTEWMMSGWFFAALAGIGTMFVLNLGVSFVLSLVTAMRAYSLPRGEGLRLARELLSHLLRSPREFLFPLRKDDLPSVEHHAHPEKQAGH